MKFLADMGMSLRTVGWLRTQGHDGERGDGEDRGGVARAVRVKRRHPSSLSRK